MRCSRGSSRSRTRSGARSRPKMSRRCSGSRSAGSAFTISTGRSGRCRRSETASPKSGSILGAIVEYAVTYLRAAHRQVPCRISAPHRTGIADQGRYPRSGAAQPQAPLRPRYRLPRLRGERQCAVRRVALRPDTRDPQGRRLFGFERGRQDVRR